MITKICRDCGETKPLADFYVHASMKDGHLNKCQSCVKKRVTAHREANVERIRAYDRLRGQLPHRKRANILRIWNAPHISAVAGMVKRALRDGLLKKEPCVKCGKPAEAHHEDYSRPLDVIWLCKKHHRLRHVELTKMRKPKQNQHL